MSIGRRRSWSLVALLGVAALLLVESAAGAGGRHHVHDSPRNASLPTWRSVYDWPNGHGYVGWQSDTTVTGEYGMQAALGGQEGLWLWPLGGHKVYDTRDYAEWTYTAPGTTRLESATLSYAWTDNLLAHHCVDMGLREPSGNVIAHQESCHPSPQRPQTITLADPAPSPTSTILYFRIRVDCGGSQTCDKTIPPSDPLKNGAYARLLKADLTLVDDDSPTLAPSGPLYELRGTYVNGTQSYGVTVHADDAGSGVKSASLERMGYGSPTGALSSRDATCDPTHSTTTLESRICPASVEYTTTIETRTLAEGASYFLERAQDGAGNAGASAGWDLFVDRTPPSAPTSVAVSGYYAESAVAVFTWETGDDPALPDGTPGAGNVYSNYRFKVNGGDWSGWQRTSDTTFATAAAEPGDTVSVEVADSDAVGNTSSVATLTAQVPPPPTPDPQIDEGPLTNPQPFTVQGQELADGGCSFDLQLDATPDHPIMELRPETWDSNTCVISGEEGELRDPNRVNLDGFTGSPEPIPADAMTATVEPSTTLRRRRLSASAGGAEYQGYVHAEAHDPFQIPVNWSRAYIDATADGQSVGPTHCWTKHHVFPDGWRLINELDTCTRAGDNSHSDSATFMDFSNGKFKDLPVPCGLGIGLPPSRVQYDTTHIRLLADGELHGAVHGRIFGGCARLLHFAPFRVVFTEIAGVPVHDVLQPASGGEPASCFPGSQKLQLNDDLVCAQVIDPNTTIGDTFPGSLAGGTIEPGENEMRASNGGLPPLEDSVWFRWTPPASATPQDLQFIGIGASADNEGANAPDTTIWEDTSGPSPTFETMHVANLFSSQFPLPGHTYYIEVGNEEGATTPATTFHLSWVCECFFAQRR